LTLHIGLHMTFCYCSIHIVGPNYVYLQKSSLCFMGTRRSQLIALTYLNAVCMCDPRIDSHVDNIVSLYGES